MAELAKKGTYVKLLCHIWYDKKADNIHVTSSDADLPPTKMHMTAKKGTQSDTNLRTLLNDFGCGPDAAKKPDALDKIVAAIESGEVDEYLQGLEFAVHNRMGALEA